jgi:hypothetical protein
MEARLCSRQALVDQLRQSRFAGFQLSAGGGEAQAQIQGAEARA